jgi:HEAT repeat protein
MKLIRSLVFPWFVYFAAILGAMFAINIKLTKYQNLPQSALLAALGLGAILCLMANLKSLSDVGIWMSESIPDALRYGGSFRWIFRAVQAAIIAAAFWGVGQFSWVPLIWHAAVVPAVFTICLFVALFSLLGPILKWSSNLAWSRAFALILSLPVFAAVPATGVFLGDSIVQAYRASHAELAVAAARRAGAEPELDPNQPVTMKARVMAINGTEMKLLTEWPIGSGKKTTVLVDTSQLTPKVAQKLPKATTPKELALRIEPKAIKPVVVVPEVITERDLRNGILSTKADKRAAAFKELYEGSRELCPNFTKEIQLALDPKGNKDVVLWAARDVECSDMRTVVGLPRLATLMTEHPDALVRAAAIRSMKKFGNENVRTVSYLLVKRLAEREPPEVVEATAEVLAPLGGDSLKWATNKLKTLLNAPHVSEAAAKALIHSYNRDDLVAEYVAENLAGSIEARTRAAAMVCLLPKPKRTIAEAHVSGIVATIKTGDQNDPGIRALDCLGKPGFQAIRQEVSQPKQLDRAVAARALAEFNVREEIPEALETAQLCARDENEQVRKYCAQTLGKIGAAALPKILELLDSSDSNLKESGRIALLSFEDPAGQTALEDVLRSNSGWMANSRKLSIAKAVGTALAKIETDKIGAEKIEAASKAEKTEKR